MPAASTRMRKTQQTGVGRQDRPRRGGSEDGGHQPLRRQGEGLGGSGERALAPVGSSAVPAKFRRRSASSRGGRHPRGVPRAAHVVGSRRPCARPPHSGVGHCLRRVVAGTLRAPWFGVLRSAVDAEHITALEVTFAPGKVAIAVSVFGAGWADEDPEGRHGVSEQFALVRDRLEPVCMHTRGGVHRLRPDSGRVPMIRRGAASIVCRFS